MIREKVYLGSSFYIYIGDKISLSIADNLNLDFARVKGAGKYPGFIEFKKYSVLQYDPDSAVLINDQGIVCKLQRRFIQLFIINNEVSSKTGYNNNHRVKSKRKKRISRKLSTYKKGDRKRKRIAAMDKRALKENTRTSYSEAKGRKVRLFG